MWEEQRLFSWPFALPPPLLSWWWKSSSSHIPAVPGSGEELLWLLSVLSPSWISLRFGSDSLFLRKKCVLLERVCKCAGLQSLKSLLTFHWKSWRRKEGNLLWTDTALNSSFNESSYERRFKVKKRETSDGINFFLCLCITGQALLLNNEKEVGAGIDFTMMQIRFVYSCRHKWEFKARHHLKEGRNGKLNLSLLHWKL